MQALEHSNAVPVPSVRALVCSMERLERWGLFESVWSSRYVGMETGYDHVCLRDACISANPAIPVRGVVKQLAQSECNILHFALDCTGLLRQPAGGHHSC